LSANIGWAGWVGPAGFMTGRARASTTGDFTRDEHGRSKVDEATTFSTRLNGTAARLRAIVSFADETSAHRPYLPCCIRGS
jgi:hypothetical protein